MLKQLALLFLKLGTISFGGPAAHIAMMEDEVVRKKKWLSSETFLDLLGATNLIPGPNSTELAIHIGHKQAGWKGLLVAGICFILPAVIIVWIIAWAYVRFGSLPEIQSLLYGVKPVMIAIVAHALYRLGRTALKTKMLMVFCLAALVTNAFGMNELLVLFGTGFLAMLWRQIKEGRMLSLNFLSALPFVINDASSRLSELFLIFLKIGSVLFGSGYVLLAFLQTDFVDHRQWLTSSQLIDAVTVGQFTPGPVFTAATFVGYLIAGHGGALLATIGIFLPAFFFVAISHPLIPRLRTSRLASSFLDGVNVASLALMAVVTVKLGKEALPDVPAIFMMLLSFFLLWRFRLNPTKQSIGAEG